MDDPCRHPEFACTICGVRVDGPALGPIDLSSLTFSPGLSVFGQPKAIARVNEILMENEALKRRIYRA